MWNKHLDRKAGSAGVMINNTYSASLLLKDWNEEKRDYFSKTSVVFIFILSCCLETVQMGEQCWPTTSEKLLRLEVQQVFTSLSFNSEINLKHRLSQISRKLIWDIMAALLLLLPNVITFTGILCSVICNHYVKSFLYNLFPVMVLLIVIGLIIICLWSPSSKLIGGEKLNGIDLAGARQK